MNILRTITFKSDDNFYKLLDHIAKLFHTSKSEIIRKAVINYKDMIEKEKLKKEIKIASMRVRENSIESLKEFEDSLDDGLENV